MSSHGYACCESKKGPVPPKWEASNYSRAPSALAVPPLTRPREQQLLAVQGREPQAVAVQSLHQGFSNEGKGLFSLSVDLFFIVDGFSNASADHVPKEKGRGFPIQEPLLPNMPC